MTQNLKLITWNVNGIRAVARKGFWDFFGNQMPDVLCLQEIKADDEVMTKWWNDTKKEFGVNTINPLVQSQGLEFEDKFEDVVNINKNIDQKEEQNQNSNSHFLENYELHWNACTIKKGYSGTAIFYHKKLKILNTAHLGIDQFDCEGRTTIIEFEYHNTKDNAKDKNSKIALINSYYPQGGRAERIPFKLEFYEQIIKKVEFYQENNYQLLLCGDLNTTVTDIDLARPKENRKTTGCLPIEREVLDRLISKVGVDSFRFIYPDKADHYTYWDQITRARERNVGWRIDYWVVDNSLTESIVSIDHLDQIMGSDHCPVRLVIAYTQN